MWVRGQKKKKKRERDRERDWRCWEKVRVRMSDMRNGLTSIGDGSRL